MEKTTDVAIIGGGLAGLTLALQLKQNAPDIAITVLEFRGTPAPIAAHKVGESTVELGTYYLREVLNLKDYLDQHHLPKHGLRYYFSTEKKERLEDCIEYGARKRLTIPSHQIDRGLLENDLVELLKNKGVNVVLGAKAKDIALADDAHTITYEYERAPQQITAKWVVDGSGRASFLKRKLDLKKDVEHDINSVWFRVKGKIDVDEWSDDQSWKDFIEPGLRRLGTIHLMGTGYWVWIIPLSTDNTSIGIVADPRFHDLKTMDSIDKAYQWLEENEPLCYSKLAPKRDQVLDFKLLKKFSYDVKQFYSSERWGVIGESGAFLDPFYSPGTDFISVGNTFMADLILREHKGEDIHTRSIIYDRVHAQFFHNWIPIYLNKYEGFGNAQVMTAKITWDFGVYWGFPTLTFTNKGFTNLNVLKAIFMSQNCYGERFAKMNQQVQNFFMEWAALGDIPYPPSYTDPMQVPSIKAMHQGIEHIHEDEAALIAKLEQNFSTLEKIAAELFRVVAAKAKGTPRDLAVNPYTMSLKQTKEELIEQSMSDGAIPYTDEIANDVSALWLDQKVIA
tara:strand:- start:4756 stop:6447 length:1692 start_codon:yes stop_codon:yes gene_type:complete